MLYTLIINNDQSCEENNTSTKSFEPSLYKCNRKMQCHFRFSIDSPKPVNSLLLLSENINASKAPACSNYMV